MLKKICKSLGLLVTAGMLLLQGAGIAEAGVLKVGARAYPYGEILAQVQPVLAEAERGVVVAGDRGHLESSEGRAQRPMFRVAMASSLALLKTSTLAW